MPCGFSLASAYERPSFFAFPLFSLSVFFSFSILLNVTCDFAIV
ncbi:hypothetical protein JCM19274_5612 [Algibacter lectus]|uniref:Uncharacterized protein n=1 Tax=Algibacter lectus TaxID=221126 RepID=A0A090WR94_9FLAO|nr:hypothetical protein JCM19274_5612 [Algibacter lectus]